MKIVISATGPTIDSNVDPRFGRASFFLLVDSESGQLIESIDNNELKNASQGAGIAAAAMVADKGAQYILTGVVGPKAMPIVEKAGMTVVSDCTGSAQDALNLFLKNHNGADTASEKTSAPSRQPKQESGCRRNGGMGRGLGKGGGTGQGGRGQGRCQQR